MKSLLEIALRLVALDHDMALTNGPEVVRVLRTKYRVSPYRARATVAKAARRRRYELRPPAEDEQWISPGAAARTLGGSPSNIRRAAALGYIPGASQDASGRWTFTVSAYREWLSNPVAHRTANHRHKP